MNARLLALILGWALLGLGVAGLFLPILQGLLLIALGLLVLSRHSPLARRLLERITARYPGLAGRLRQWRRRISSAWTRKRVAMKRDKNLFALSWDHHHGLVLAHEILKALRQGLPADGALARAREFWDGGLEFHFAAEEEVLLPLLEAELPACAAHAARIRLEHRNLRALLDEAAGAEGEERKNALWRFAEQLQDHIRYEERQVFHNVQKSAPASLLEKIGEEFRRRYAGRYPDLPE